MTIPCVHQIQLVFLLGIGEDYVFRPLIHYFEQRIEFRKGWKWAVSLQALVKIPLITLLPLCGDLEAPKYVDGLTRRRMTLQSITLPPSSHPLPEQGHEHTEPSSRD